MKGDSAVLPITDTSNIILQILCGEILPAAVGLFFYRDARSFFADSYTAHRPRMGLVPINNPLKRNFNEQELCCR
jgi:hypothetical protein